MFSARPPGLADEAWSTNKHVYLAPLDDPAARIEISAGNPGYDLSPRFAPDGQRVLWASLATAQYESDAVVLKTYDLATGVVHTVGADWDYSPSGLVWLDSHTVLADAPRQARQVIVRIDLDTGAWTTLVDAGSCTLPGRIRGDWIVFGCNFITSPTELFIAPLTPASPAAAPKRITFFCEAGMRDVQLGAAEELRFAGARGETVQAWLVRPVHFAAERRYPMAVLIHGGPQGSFKDGWLLRWNMQLYAAHGYVVLAVNFHGSNSFGHAFCRSISGDWGGAPFEDIMLGVDHVLQTCPYVDPARLAALGASFGGYMVNWINGHTDRFKALVCHDGLFSSSSAYVTTEELFFFEFEFNGAPWHAGFVDHNSPHTHVHQWKTPTLVIHGGRDYRLVDGEGVAAFTALRRNGVPAELLYFPQENHWVVRPEHSIIWHTKVLAWLDRWCSS